MHRLYNKKIVPGLFPTIIVDDNSWSAVALTV